MGLSEGSRPVRQPVASPGTTVPVIRSRGRLPVRCKPAPLITTHFHQSRRLLTRPKTPTESAANPRTDCTSINMRYTPHGPKTHAVQRNTLINTMISPQRHEQPGERQLDERSTDPDYFGPDPRARHRNRLHPLPLQHRRSRRAVSPTFSDQQPQGHQPDQSACRPDRRGHVRHRLWKQQRAGVSLLAA